MNNAKNHAHAPVKLTLDDGTRVLLRRYEDQDADDLFRFYRALPDEDRMNLKVDVTNRKIFNELNGSIQHGLVNMILALRDGKIIGESALHINLHGWARHVGELRAVILRQYIGIGLTRSMLRAQIEAANAQGVDKIVYRILDTQKAAKKALETLGFRQEAVLKLHATDLNGDKHDMIIMSNFVADLWRKMEDLIQDTDFEMIP